MPRISFFFLFYFLPAYFLSISLLLLPSFFYFFPHPCISHMSLTCSSSFSSSLSSSPQYSFCYSLLLIYLVLPFSSFILFFSFPHLSWSSLFLIYLGLLFSSFSFFSYRTNLTLAAFQEQQEMKTRRGREERQI